MSPPSSPHRLTKYSPAVVNDADSDDALFYGCHAVRLSCLPSNSGLHVANFYQQILHDPLLASSSHSHCWGFLDCLMFSAEVVEAKIDRLHGFAMGNCLTVSSSQL